MGLRQARMRGPFNSSVASIASTQPDRQQSSFLLLFLEFLTIFLEHSTRVPVGAFPALC
jgi:hypothetical protein